jgi:hypothetical protein
MRHCFNRGWYLGFNTQHPKQEHGTMNTFSSMRRDFLRTGSFGAAAAVFPAASLAASVQQAGAAPQPAQGAFDVRMYGATGDGRTLDTAAVSRRYKPEQY